MSLNSPSPKGQSAGKAIFQYIGQEQPELNGLLFMRIAEFDAKRDGKPSTDKWPNSTDEWKYGFGQETVFLMTIPRNDLQPPPVKKLLCSTIETPEDFEVGNEGAGGFFYSSTEENFKRDFKQKGKQ